jgi:hypothetical protein
VRNTRGGGLWHGVDYEKEVVDGEYEHLAIVRNPRYAESKIFTPEQFKQYNEEKEAELLRLANSKEKGESSMKLKFWKKTQVEKLENASDLESITVELPKTKREVSIADLIKNADLEAKDSYANGEHKVKVGEEEMTVNELVEKHLSLKQKLGKDEEGEAANDAEEFGKDEIEPKNEEEEEKEKKEIDKQKNELESKRKDLEKRESDFSKRKENFSKLYNTQSQRSEAVSKVETSSDKVARGRSRYGS